MNIFYTMMNKEQRWILARYLIIEKEIIGKHGKNTNLGIRSRGWSKKTKQTWGKNWDERDSLFLVEAVEYADGSKKRIVTHMRIILIKASESKASVDKRMGDFYNNLMPSEPRTVKAAVNRFAEMESSYKFK